MKWKSPCKLARMTVQQTTGSQGVWVKLVACWLPTLFLTSPPMCCCVQSHTYWALEGTGVYVLKKNPYVKRRSCYRL